MPKYIYICFVLFFLLHCPFLSFCPWQNQSCCPFFHFSQRTSFANQFSYDGNICPFFERTDTCRILLRYLYPWSIYTVFFKWIICHCNITLTSFFQLNPQILGWIEWFSTVHKYLQNKWSLLKSKFMEMLNIIQY